MEYNTRSMTTGYDIDVGGAYDMGIASAYSAGRNQVAVGSGCPTGGRCGTSCTNRCKG